MPAVDAVPAPETGAVSDVSVAVPAGVVVEVAPAPAVAETRAVLVAPAPGVRVAPVLAPPAEGVVPDGVAVAEEPPGTTDATTLVPETRAVTGEDIVDDGYF